jgi:hypothetical protein
MSPVSNRALWFGLCGAPAAWSLQLMADYAVAAHGCFPHQTPLSRPVLAVHVITGICGGLAVLIALAALVVSARNWATARRAGATVEDEVRTGPKHLARVRFMAIAGMMTGTLFAFGAVLNAISPALVPPCW